MNGSDDDGELYALREAIRRVDEGIVRLAAERVRLARAAGALKRTQGRPVRDLEQEAAVLARAAELARQIGLDPAGVRELFAELLRLAREAQAKDG